MAVAPAARENIMEVIPATSMDGLQRAQRRGITSRIKILVPLLIRFQRIAPNLTRSSGRRIRLSGIHAKLAGDVIRRRNEQVAVDWVVVLVHGTWDSGAPWTRAQSRLCRYIRDRFSGVRFNRLVWTGENSCQARWNAADRLQERLAHLRRAYPAARLIVIAHSHGGNVALYACRRDDVDRMVDGIVCLATPFVSAHAQRIYGDMPLALFTTGAMASLAGISLAPMALASIGFYILTLLSLASMALRNMRRRRRGLHYDLYDAAALCDRLTVKAPPSTSLLILTTEGDEASAVLAVSQAARWLVRALVEFPQSLPRQVQALKNDPRRARSNLHRWGINVVAFTGLMVGNAFSAVTLPIALAVHIISIRVLGVPLMRDAMRVEVTAEPFPPGEATAVRLPSQSENRSLGQRSHSDPVNNDRVFYAIYRWMMHLREPSEGSEREKRRDRFYGTE